MGSRGPRNGGQRAKSSKHLRAGTEKRFDSDDPEKLAAYKAKIAARAHRKLKKKSRR